MRRIGASVTIQPWDGPLLLGTSVAAVATAAPLAATALAGITIDTTLGTPAYGDNANWTPIGGTQA